MDDSKTFREELAIQYPTLGRALWEPDPGGLYNAVQVGDVGFIRHGYFYCLFNALLPRDAPPDHLFESDLHYPQRLQPRMSNHIRASIDHCKDFCSKNVTNVDHEPNIGALGPDDDTRVTFSCSGKQGALLYLPLPATQEDTVALGDFSKWIVQNIHDCMRFADERGLGVNRMEDIILVTGRHLAKSWVRTVFSETRRGGRGAQVSFVAKVCGDSVVRLEERNMSGAQLKFGPNGEEGLPENQCIFVRGYHVVRILNIWPKLRGLAGPAHLPGPEREPDTHLELMGVPNDGDDPLHTLSAYIAEQTPSCDMVLVHDDDLKCIKNAVPPLETLQPDALMGFLRDSAPTIRQFQCEISSRNEDGSEAEIAVATVATVSQSVFEAPPPSEGNIINSSWTSNTTSSEYEDFTEEPEGFDGHIMATGFDPHLEPDDVENRFQTQVHTGTQSKSPSYPAPDGQSFRRDRPTRVEVPKLDSTMGLPFPNPHLATRNLHACSSIPIVQVASQPSGAFTPFKYPRIADTLNPTIHGQIPGQLTPYSPISPTHHKQSHHHLTSHNPLGRGFRSAPTVPRAADLGLPSDSGPYPSLSSPGRQPTDAGAAGPQKCRLPDCTLNTYFDEYEQQWTEYCGQGHQLQAVASGLVATCVMCKERPRRLTEPVCSRTCREQAGHATRVDAIAQGKQPERRHRRTSATTDKDGNTMEAGSYYGIHVNRLKPRASNPASQFPEVAQVQQPPETRENPETWTFGHLGLFS